MIQGFAGLMYVANPTNGTVDTVRRFNPDGTSTDLFAASTEPFNNMVQIDLSGSPMSQVGIYLFLVKAAAGVFLGSEQADVVAAGGGAPTAADIWAYATRRVSDATNITSNAATIDQTKIANLDAAVTTRLSTAGYTVPPTANANADALLDRVDAIETGLTPRQAMRLDASALAGKVSISGATVTIRNTADTKSRIIATTTTSGERTAVTTDVS